MIIHRDLKHTNVLIKCVGSYAFVRVIDFGFSKLFVENYFHGEPEASTSQLDLTANLGTHGYAAPELFNMMNMMKKLTFTVWVKLLAKCSKIFVEKLSMFKHDNSEADILSDVDNWKLDHVTTRRINTEGIGKYCRHFINNTRIHRYVRALKLESIPITIQEKVTMNTYRLTQSWAHY